MKYTLLNITAMVSVLTLASCGTDPLSPGVEYMPDMYRSPAQEAYLDYNNPNNQSARQPVAGTIPFSADLINGSPFEYPNTPEAYEAAGANLKNPLPYSDVTKEEGKKLYETFCIQCHGAAGDGDGSVVKILTEKRDNYSLKPPSYSKQLANLPEGKIFFSITYGKNNMGSHASQLTKEERWKVAHYVQFLMRGGKAPGETTTVITDSLSVVK